MKIGIPMSYSGGFLESVDELCEYEAVGADLIQMPEAYSFDAVSQLGFIAARTTTAQLASNILNIYSRTPALLAMTAAGLDYVSGGRFVLGLGVSGPQVIEGFHGVPYDAPLGRTREVVEICRMIWRRDGGEHHGRHYDLPLDAAHGGGGLGKPLKLINHPVRAAIPVVLASLGPKSVQQAAEIADGWAPMLLLPEKADEVFGAALRAGQAKRASELAALEIFAGTKLLISEDSDAVDAAVGQVRKQLALYVGGMGARGKNFYNDLVSNYGYAEAAAEVQDLYLAGHKAEAEQAVPEALVNGLSLIGAPGHVRERVAAYAEAGVSVLSATPLARTRAQRVKDVSLLKEFVQ